MASKKLKSGKVIQLIGSNSVRLERRWEDLDPNILIKIFSQISFDEIWLSVSFVCLSWQVACLDIFFWSQTLLNLAPVTVGLHSGTYSSLNKYNEPNYFSLYDIFESFNPKIFDESQEKNQRMLTKLSRLLRRVMEGYDAYGRPLEGWRQSVRTLVIPYDLPISDSHLVYIAKRIPGIECLMLLGTTRVSATVFAKAVKMWKLLKHIHIGPVDLSPVQPIACPIYSHFIKEIGVNCQKLESLHIYQRFLKINTHSSRLIAQNLPGLKRLELEAVVFSKEGILTLFQMSHLEEVFFFVSKFFLEESSMGRRYRNSIWFRDSYFVFRRGVDIGWHLENYKGLSSSSTLSKVSNLLGLGPVAGNEEE